MSKFEVIEGHQNMDLVAVHSFLTRSYWSPGVPLEIVQKAAENSLCFGVRSDSGQVAFARVVTDRATFAYLCDVYVLEEYRGLGLSRRMLEQIVQHPDLQQLRRFMLVTRDAHGLYSRFGFEVTGSPDRIMEILRTNPYLARPASEEELSSL